MALKQDDFFGDGDFLTGFDVDAVIRNARNNNNQNDNKSKENSLQQNVNGFPGLDLDTVPSKPNPYAPSAAKRPKVTPSPRPNQYQSVVNPFPPNSKFSLGTKTDASELLDTSMPATETSFSAVSDVMVPTTNNNEKKDTTDGNSSNKALQETMQRYFGFDSFRNGQQEVLEALLQNRDAAVFWATGTGKSLCYQIPPLHTHKVGLVVSPLISLMQDQVNKLNGLSDTKLATYLGSSQMDASEEIKALNGEYPLVYVTPEKLLSNGFLDRLADMHSSKKRLCLVAIDESHCVSEWGHDFRPEFRKLGEGLRGHPILKQIPIVALTATAVPRVQNDICESLRLRNVYLARQSFDRTNLDIAIHKKDRGGFRAALESAVKEFQQQQHSSLSQSTIVYAPTRDLVEEIAAHLQTQLGNDAVQPYHGGMNHAERTEAHMNFLVGRTKIIVATVAFGMGIDKTDTRRVLHYGPPKTVEEYYQQIGRAGRDGRQAECVMYVSDTDFVKYKSDFYLASVPTKARESLEKSMDALRNYALDTVKCRRKALLDFFQETSPFGERCGACDTCRNNAKYGPDGERDFGNEGARVVLASVGALNGQSLGIIEKVMSGNQVESYRYRYGQNATSTSRVVVELREKMSKKRPKTYFKELFAPLVSKGYLKQATKKATINGFSNTWGTYELTTLGASALNNTSVAITLPVPPSLREIEQQEEEKRQRSLKKLEDAGVNLEEIPKEEIEAGDGAVIRSYKTWHNYLESLRRRSKEDRIAHLDALLTRIEEWRSKTAAELRMAPAAVLAEHQIYSVAYTTACNKPGVKVERDALVMAGVRTRGVDSLVAILGEWVEQIQPRTDEVSNDRDDLRMILPEEPFVPATKWEHVVYKPKKKTGTAAWESSYKRFLDGDHPQTIAMSPENGRPIQVSTVVGHILDGLTHGRPVPLHRLAEVLPPPTKSEWSQFEQTERETGQSVTGDPQTSGIEGEKFTMTEFLRPIMGDEFVDTPYNERTEEDKTRFGKLCDSLKWYMALRRTNYGPPMFESCEEDEMLAA